MGERGGQCCFLTSMLGEVGVGGRGAMLFSYQYVGRGGVGGGVGAGVQCCFRIAVCLERGGHCCFLTCRMVTEGRGGGGNFFLTCTLGEGGTMLFSYLYDGEGGCFFTSVLEEEGQCCFLTCKLGEGGSMLFSYLHHGGGGCCFFTCMLGEVGQWFFLTCALGERGSMLFSYLYDGGGGRSMFVL